MREIRMRVAKGACHCILGDLWDAQYVAFSLAFNTAVLDQCAAKRAPVSLFEKCLQNADRHWS